MRTIAAIPLMALAVAAAGCGGGVSKHYDASEVRGCLVDKNLSMKPADLPGDVSPDGTQGDLAVVLEGALVKSFPRRALELGRSNAVAIPVGATHGARFGSDGARILIVRARSPSDPVAGCFDRVAELRASDAAAPLAAEGFALELLAATTREVRVERSPGRPPAWLRSAEELLRARLADRIGLGELAEAVGVHPTYLARSFRAHYGLSVGEYGRRLRLAWAAAELARGEKPLAEIAASAGFSDQSHFTRVFGRQVGTTPARYRERAQSRTFQNR